MNYKKSLEVLELPENYTAEQLKRSYYKKALNMHPDKNPKGEEMFKEINNAYQFLNGKHVKIDNSYEAIIKRYLELNYPHWGEQFIDQIIKIFIQKIETTAFDLFSRMNKNVVMDLYRVLSLMGVNDE